MKVKSLEDLSEMWSKDGQMDDTEPSREMAKTVKLHSKYRSIRAEHAMIVKKLEVDLAKEKKFKYLYYRGDPEAEEEMEARGLDDYHKHGKVLQQNLQLYLDADQDIININLKKSLHAEVVDYCDDILREINNRTYQLNGIIKWEIFTSGG